MLTLCAQDELVEETPATALAALARQERGEVRVSTLTPQESQSEASENQQFSSNMQRWRQLRGLDCNAIA